MNVGAVKWTVGWVLLGFRPHAIMTRETVGCDVAMVRRFLRLTGWVTLRAAVGRPVGVGGFTRWRRDHR